MNSRLTKTSEHEENETQGLMGRTLLGVPFFKTLKGCVLINDLQ